MGKIFDFRLTLLLFLTPLAFAAGCDVPMFAGARLFAAGFSPAYLAVGDFNHDGIPDVAVTSSSTNSVSILLSNGDGTFQPAVNYTQPQPKYIVAADFNGDGKLDLAIAANDNLVVMLGNGDGTFGPAIVTKGPVGEMVVGDFNGDGKPDLAVAYIPASVMLGNGDGTFQPPIFNPNVFDAGFSVAVGDFNGDGKLDVIAGATGGVFLLLGDGKGGLSAPVTFSTGNSFFAPAQVAAGDLNGDGKLDIVTLSPLDSSIYVLLGNGDGTFQPSTTYAAGNVPGLAVTAMVLVDLNGDGKLDLALNNQTSVTSGVGAITVFSGNGDGSFQMPVQYVPASQADTALGVGDFNGDGLPDLVFTSLATTLPTQLGVMFGGKNGAFQSPPSYLSGPGPGMPVIADFNGDGVPDMAVVDSGFSGNLAVLMGNGDGTFQPAAYYLTAFGAGSVAAGDFNGDGKPDLAVANGTGQNILIFLGNGDGTFMNPLSSRAPLGGATFVTVGDFNNDGKLDLAALGLIGGVQIYLGNGDGTFHGGFSSGFGFSSPMGPPVVADLNGDGNLDLVLPNGTVNGAQLPVAGAVSVMLGNGDGTFKPAVAYMIGSKATSVAVGDVNGDGRPDLAVIDYGAANVAGDVAVLLGNGDGTFQTPVKYGVLPGSNSLLMSDVNGDGNMDLVIASSGPSSSPSGFVTVLLGVGDGTFRNTLTYGAGADAVALTTGDLNSDGKPDLVVADDVSNSLVVLLNNYAGGSHASVCAPVAPLSN